MSSLTAAFGQQTVNFQTACHPEDVKHYDTKTLRERFVMEKVMEADKINLTYSHYDRFIFGGAMPVNKTLKLENFLELGLDVDPNIKEKYFLYNRELGVVNCGQGDGVVIVDGKEYALSPKEALYIGRGHIGKDKDVNKEVLFRSKDAAKPAKFYLNSATAHQHYKTQWITLDGRKGSLKAAVWGPVGSLEECNNRTVYKLIVNDVLEEGPCQLQLGLTQLNPGAAWNTMPPTPTAAASRPTTTSTCLRTRPSPTSWASPRRAALSGSTTSRPSCRPSGRCTPPPAPTTTPSSGAWPARTCIIMTRTTFPSSTSDDGTS